MAESAFLVGSTRLEGATIEVNGNDVALTGGYYYLRHATASLSLIDHVQQQVQSEVGDAVFFLTEGLRVRQTTSPGNPVAIDWLDATAWRDALGWTSNLASSAFPHQASSVSPLLWVPGWVATPATLLGTSGWVKTDATRHTSADGTRHLVTQYYEQVHQDLTWSAILAERLRVPDGQSGNGTFHTFYEAVLKRGYSVRHYQAQVETDGSTDAVTWDDSDDNSFGPYVLREHDPQWYRRVVEYADLYGSLDLPLMRVQEY